MNDVILVKQGINGGSSLLSILPEDFIEFNVGSDGNIRMMYGENSRSYPIIEVLECPEDILRVYLVLQEYAND